ncbi:hypothetical protein ACFO0N_05255 [Halobium salinum]|uniref:Uncharacterized protein n=1 Tax=Halobium salinum TaxID=1364940 RepID=A0ABD5P9G2_9EURY|nr:hypothetical protein [Halobium salinum]
MSERPSVSRRTVLKTLGTVGVFGAVASVPSVADTATSSNADTTVTWERRYRKTLDDELFIDGVQDVVDLDDGYLLGGGARPYRGPGMGYVWLARTDEAGNRRWERTHPTGRESELDYVTMGRTADGGFAVGANGAGDDGKLHGYGLKVDASGESVWTADFGPSNIGAVAAGDGAAFAGVRYRQDDEGQPYPLFVTKRASDGSESWTWAGSVDPEDNSETDRSPKHDATAAIGTDDGGVLVAGVTRYSRAGAVEGLLKFSAEGDLEWRSVAIDDRYGGESGDVDDLLQLGDGGYAVLGDSGSYEDGDVVVTRVSDEGEVVGAASLEGPTEGSDDASAFVRSGTGYTISSHVDGDPDRAQVMQTTDGTSVEWTALLEDPEFDLYAGDVVDAGSGVVVGGNFGQVKQDNGAFLLKLVESDAEGGADGTTPDETTTPESEPDETTTPESEPDENTTEEPSRDESEETTPESPEEPTSDETTADERSDAGAGETTPEETPSETTDEVDEDGDGCPKND